MAKQKFQRENDSIVELDSKLELQWASDSPPPRGKQMVLDLVQSVSRHLALM